jgi:hypothetical protein
MRSNRDKRHMRLVSRGALLVLGASLVCIAVGQAVQLSTGLLVLVLSAGLASIGAFVGLESAARVRERDDAVERP